jgi:hypothetical protein
VTDYPLSELSPAPECFVDGYESHSVTNGVVKLTLWSFAYDPVTKSEGRRIVLRLTMPLATAHGIKEGLGQLMEAVEKAAKNV